MQPSDARDLTVFLERAAARRSRIRALIAATGVLLVFLVAAFVVDPLVAGKTLAAAVALSVVIAVVIVAVPDQSLGSIARDVEQRVPASRNLLLTGAEIVDGTTAGGSYAAVFAVEQAARIARSLSLPALFPARRAGGAFALALVFWIAALVLLPDVAASARDSLAQPAEIERIDVTVTPPTYSRRDIQRLRDPVRIEAFAGSRIQVRIRSPLDSLAIVTLDGRVEMKNAAGAHEAEITARDDGYVAVHSTRDTAQGALRLIGLSVTPDRAPVVRITEPARDLIVPDAARTVPLRLEAADDIALTALSLRYTKVSGSGEQFTFVEGDVPVSIQRDSTKGWRATAALALGGYTLEPGDMLVYRAVARDARPGAPVSESDTYIIEVAAPGAAAAAGFAIDDEMDRYGLSQQMVITKTEQLIARQRTLARDTVVREAAAIAAEQRAVRAEFVFMMGGELAEEVIDAAGLSDLDETAEAEAEDDILAGRLANRGRIDLVRAIRSMSRASAALIAGDLDKALADEKAALTYLQGAFARARYILRALTQRERLDMERRLSGTLAGVFRDVRARVTPASDSRVVTLRRTLALAAELSGTAELGANDATRALAAAQDVLRLDPSSEILQRISESWDRGARRVRANEPGAARQEFAATTTLLAGVLRNALPAASPTLSSPALEALSGTLADELRRRR